MIACNGSGANKETTNYPDLDNTIFIENIAANLDEFSLKHTDAKRFIFDLNRSLCSSQRAISQTLTVGLSAISQIKSINSVCP